MVPVSPFPSKYKSLKSGGLEYVTGIFPVKVLLDKYTNWRVGTSNIESGILPVRELDNTSMVSNRSNASNTSGREPRKKLLLMTIFSVD